MSTAWERPTPLHSAEVKEGPEVTPLQGPSDLPPVFCCVFKAQIRRGSPQECRGPPRQLQWLLGPECILECLPPKCMRERNVGSDASVHIFQASACSVCVSAFAVCPRMPPTPGCHQTLARWCFLAACAPRPGSPSLCRLGGFFVLLLCPSPVPAVSACDLFRVVWVPRCVWCWETPGLLSK